VTPNLNSSPEKMVLYLSCDCVIPISISTRKLPCYLFWFMYSLCFFLFLDFLFVTNVSSSYHLWVECFSQISFDSEVYTKSAAVADFVYTSESNESCEKHSTERW
jgi:hypothetical protein